MKKRALINLGYPQGVVLKAAQAAAREARIQGLSKLEVRRALARIVKTPGNFEAHPLWRPVAQALGGGAEGGFVPRRSPAPYQRWGDDIEDTSIGQMESACQLPVSVRGALMPDAHPGYGLPIGGVLAVRNAVIPYAVGVDIACRMKLSVLDLSLEFLDRRVDRLRQAIEQETRFGIGSSFQKRREHSVLDRDWALTPLTSRLKDKAWAQLGTSGSGNHFVEFGVFTLEKADLGLESGQYLALLTHSGSRGPGATVASHYSRLAMDLHRELPRSLRHLSWLELGTQEGQEYWQAMQLMGEYASANHACIHKCVLKALGARVLKDVENHHNFAWKEEHDGEAVIVHRKGATPAGQGVLGIIPGSMASPGYLVRGRGHPGSLNSAAHGAGRVMSRTQAKSTLKWSDARNLLKQKGVTLLSAGIDEVPMVYKNINDVMSAQADLVDIVGRFDPRLVKMAPSGEPPED